MIHVKATVEIARPAAEVFAFLADFANNPAWQKGMVSARFTTEGPLRVGSEYDQEARFLGRPILSHFRVTELVADRAVTIETVQSTFPIKVRRAVEPVTDTTCRVTADVRGDASGLFKLAAPLMRAMVGKSVRDDYARLKQLLESGP